MVSFAYIHRSRFATLLIATFPSYRERGMEDLGGGGGRMMKDTGGEDELGRKEKATQQTTSGRSLKWYVQRGIPHDSRHH
jgi:hypothetical protein